MIKNFKHKGLEKLYITGIKPKVNQGHVFKLRFILTRLEASCKPEDMDLPEFYFHVLRGNMKGYYSVMVNGNWRVTFKFEGKDACNVNYVDYH